MDQTDKHFIRIMEAFPFNASDDLRRHRAGNPQFDKEWCELRRRLKEDTEIDENYQGFLCHLPYEEKSEPHNKRKRNDDASSKRDDYCSDEEENDPQYELFLKQLKAHDKSYAAEFEKNGLPVVIKYESDVVSGEGCHPQAQPGFLNEMSGAKDPHRHSSQSTSVRKTEDPIRRQPKNRIIEVENVKRSTNGMDRENLNLHQNVKIKDDHHMQMDSTGVTEKIYGVNDQKVRFSDEVFALENHLKNDLINIDEKNIREKGKYENYSDVEILDGAACPQEGILSPFVPCRRLAKEDDKLQHMESKKARRAFRRRVLDLIKRPFDKEEYESRQLAVKDGRYLEYNPDLGEQLKLHRYNRRKRLTILRGFFFWLQNLTQEGAFKPWEDNACLAVELE